MISILLLLKIAQLFFPLALGFILVRFKILKSSDTKVLSAIALYAVTPCVILGIFQTEVSSQLLRGLLFSAISALAAHLVFFLLAGILKKPLRLSPVDRANSIYSNCGDLLVPIVGSLFGAEALIYTIPFIVVQLPFVWSHCRVLISGKRGSLKNLLLNVNILSVAAGAGFFAFRIVIPEKLLSPINDVAAMIGPLGMLIAGMLIAGMDLKKVFSAAGVWKVAALRLLVFPAVMMLLLRLSHVTALVPDGQTIFLISFLAMCAPSASAVTQQALLYSDDGEYSGAIYTVTTLLCIVTMPLMIFLFGLSS